MLREKSWEALPGIRNPRISMGVELPFGIEKSLELNIPRVETMMQLGGIRSLAVKSDDREVTRFYGTFEGNDGDSAIAGRISATTVPKYEYYSHDSVTEDVPLKANTWHDTVMTVHTGEVKRRLMEKREHVGNKEVWSHEIDSVMRHGLMRAGIRHLMATEEIPGYEKISIALAYLISITYIDHQPTIIAPLVTGIMANIGKTFLTKREMIGSGNRNSILMGIEADRALVLGIYGLVKPVVRPIKED